MNKVMLFVRLDFITVKPYLKLKETIFYITVISFAGAVTGWLVPGIMILMASVASYPSYPFAVGVKGNMDVLYATLSIKQSTVVLGRYLFALLLGMCMGILAFAVSSVTMIIKNAFNPIESLLTMFVSFIVFSIIQAIQLPIYFRYAYIKVKFMTEYSYILTVLLVIILILPFTAMNDPIAGFLKWFAANSLLTVPTSVVVWFAIMSISYKASLSLYSKRDF